MSELTRIREIRTTGEFLPLFGGAFAGDRIIISPACRSCGYWDVVGDKIIALDRSEGLIHVIGITTGKMETVCRDAQHFQVIGNSLAVDQWKERKGRAKEFGSRKIMIDLAGNLAWATPWRCSSQAFSHTPTPRGIIWHSKNVVYFEKGDSARRVTLVRNSPDVIMSYDCVGPVIGTVKDPRKKHQGLRSSILNCFDWDGHLRAVVDMKAWHIEPDGVGNLVLELTDRRVVRRSPNGKIEEVTRVPSVKQFACSTAISGGSIYYYENGSFFVLHPDNTRNFIASWPNFGSGKKYHWFHAYGAGVLIHSEEGAVWLAPGADPVHLFPIGYFELKSFLPYGVITEGPTHDNYELTVIK